MLSNAQQEDEKRSTQTLYITSGAIVVIYWRGMGHSILEGTAHWSAVLVGALEMPIEFVIEAVSSGHVIVLEDSRGG